MPLVPKSSASCYYYTFSKLDQLYQKCNEFTREIFLILVTVELLKRNFWNGYYFIENKGVLGPLMELDLYVLQDEVEEYPRQASAQLMSLLALPRQL